MIQRLRSHPAGNILLAFLILQAVAITGGLLFPDDFRYLSPINIAILLKSFPVLGVLALGVGVLMIAGEFDLSVGSVYTFTAVVMATWVQMGISAWVAAPGAICIGVLIGLFHGAITLRFAIPSFIVTLGGLLFWRGAVLLYHGATSLRFNPDDVFSATFAGTFGVFNMNFVWFVILSAAFWMLLHHHKLGNHFYAVGGNRTAAIAIGINPVKVKLIAFSLSGAMAAMAGILATSRVNSILPGQGDGLELQAIAACVIGGFALTGGRGTILGVFLGAAFIYTIQDILLLLRAPGFFLDMFIAAFLVGAAILNQSLRGRLK